LYEKRSNECTQPNSVGIGNVEETNHLDEKRRYLYETRIYIYQQRSNEGTQLNSVRIGAAGETVPLYEKRPFFSMKRDVTYMRRECIYITRDQMKALNQIQYASEPLKGTTAPDMNTLDYVLSPISKDFSLEMKGRKGGFCN